jgi:hypothetical protein
MVVMLEVVVETCIEVAVVVAASELLDAGKDQWEMTRSN